MICSFLHRADRSYPSVIRGKEYFLSVRYYIITVESMFVKIFPFKSSCDIVVITVRFFTLTTKAVLSTSTSVSLLPFSAAISMPSLSLCSISESSISIFLLSIRFIACFEKPTAEFLASSSLCRASANVPPDCCAAFSAFPAFAVLTLPVEICRFRSLSYQHNTAAFLFTCCPRCFLPELPCSCQPYFPYPR